MSVFLWYSKSSEETGAWLAERLNISGHGTKPPREFEGTVICWGAAPSEKFRWEKRNFQAIFNDPRVIRPLLNREDLFKKIEELGIPTTKFSKLSLMEGGVPVVHNYSQWCTALEVSEEVGFIACSPGGFKKRTVTSQAKLEEAIADERTCVTTAQFTEKKRIRVFVANGVVVGAARFTDTIPVESTAAVVAASVSSGWGEFTAAQCQAVLSRAVELDLIAAKGGVWTPHSVTNAATRNHVMSIAATLKFDFCAVDFADDGSGTVINIITTPNLREVTTVQSAITNAVSSWLYKNSRTAKDILLEVIGESTSEEASSLLEELSSLRGTVKLKLKKDEAVTADKVTSGADSKPSKSA